MKEKKFFISTPVGTIQPYSDRINSFLKKHQEKRESKKALGRVYFERVNLI